MLPYVQDGLVKGVSNGVFIVGESGMKKYLLVLVLLNTLALPSYAYSNCKYEGKSSVVLDYESLQEVELHPEYITRLGLEGARPAIEIHQLFKLFTACYLLYRLLNV